MILKMSDFVQIIYEMIFCCLSSFSLCFLGRCLVPVLICASFGIFLLRLVFLYAQGGSGIPDYRVLLLRRLLGGLAGFGRLVLRVPMLQGRGSGSARLIGR